MLRGLGNVVVKELKELLRDPKILIGMIVVPLIMFPILGFAIRGSIESVEERLQMLQIGVVDFDRQSASEDLKAFLQNNLTVTLVSINASDIGEAVRLLQTDTNATDLIIIPSGFTQNISQGNPAYVEIYSVFSGTRGIAEIASSSIVSEYLEFYRRDLAPEPFNTISKSIVKGKPTDVPPSTLFTIMSSQVFVLPTTISILLVFSMQIAATSVASEKEEKTLETLLSLPISRFTILAGKLVGSIIVAAVGAVTIMIGFNYYMGSFMLMGDVGSGPVDLAAIGLAPTPLGYVILGASIFMALLSALALAIIISAFAQDVRGAQSIVGYLYVLIMLPMIIIMFTDFNALPLTAKIILLAVPYSHPMLAAQDIITGNYLAAVSGVIYVGLFTVALLYAASRLFSTEKILTAKLKFRGLKFKRKKIQNSENP
ncbi:MAG: ABC transporter permease [Candidatus Bathyarchaeota archaeon]|nr:MAG: ABC transporter permease [Candidatus Bathyarchaeota archaeon]